MENAYARKNTTTSGRDTRNEAKNASAPEMMLPNSVISRIMELPEAEAEADRLSAGVTSGTPATVRREMGGRLGADLSGVRFHSGPSSVRQSEALGAQAWTQGRDVYFGSGGFTPSLAAHELVHTVQQGAVRGNVSQSMPAGSVQLKPKKKKEDEEPKLENAKAQDFARTEEDEPLPGDVSDLTALETQLMNTFSTSRGLNVFNAIQKDIRDLIPRIRKRSDGQRWQIKFRPKSAASFLVRAAYQDYALRDILTEIVGKGVGLFKTNVRIRQYKALIKSISDRLGPYQVQELLSQAGMLVDEPRADRKNENKRRVNKRAYDFDSRDPEADEFNPGNIPEVRMIQDEIDAAGTWQYAYKVFARFTGAPDDVGITYQNKKEKGEFGPDMKLFKKKLKHMARQVWEYPELRGTIGDLRIFDSSFDAKMGTVPTYGGREPSRIYYSSYYDRPGEEAEAKRRADDAEREATGEWNGDRDHNGNHELGHILASNMPMRNGSQKEAEDSNMRNELETDIVKEVLLNRDILTDEQKSQIKYYQSDGHGEGKYARLKHYKGQLDLMGSAPLNDRRITSHYGQYAANEFFAETFADVYTHGQQAKRTSIETVKEYEKRQKALQRAKYKYNQSNWFMKLFRKKVA